MRATGRRVKGWCPASLVVDVTTKGFLRPEPYCSTAVHHAVATHSWWMIEVRWPPVVVSHGIVKPRVAQAHLLKTQEREWATPRVHLVDDMLAQLGQPSNNALLIISQIELILQQSERRATSWQYNSLLGSHTVRHSDPLAPMCLDASFHMAALRTIAGRLLQWCARSLR